MEFFLGFELSVFTISFLTERLGSSVGLNFLDRSQYYDQWTGDKVDKADIAVTYRTAIIWMSVGMKLASPQIIDMNFFYSSPLISF